MSKTKIKDNRVIRIILFTAEETVAARIKEYSHPDFVRTQVTQLNSISDFADSTTASPDLLIVDVTEDCNVESLFTANARRLLTDTEIVVLCASEDSVKWQEYVLRQEIADCFIIRPLHDPAYLKVQIWRAIRTCLKKDLLNGNDESVTTGPNTDSELQFAGLQALVLEDDAPSAEAISDMLTGFGFNVRHATSVVEGVRKYRDSHFDIFLVDLMMPGISGSDVVLAVRDKLKDAAAPIIVTSAFSDDELVKECIAKGASDYIIKPITRSRILPRLLNALANK